ncbi:MAG TPA: hypothetical protein VEC06_06290, partial [Paucimonas sp.]|nr:hypothetical protein [Paucimonas sp.]
ALPALRACLRHKYSVASGIPVNFDTSGTRLFCGALISAKACSFFSFVCCVIASLITPGVYRTPINGGDNYFDAEGARDLMKGALNREGNLARFSYSSLTKFCENFLKTRKSSDYDKN